MSNVEEIAKAVQKVANFGSDALVTTKGLGAFLSNIFGSPAAEISGIITDRIKYIRWIQLLHISERVNEILAERGIEEPSSIAPKLAIPMLENSSLEEDEDLQKLWINLITNSMDRNFGDEIRYAYIEIIKNLTSLDALIMKEIYADLSKEVKLTPDHVRNVFILKESLCDFFKIPEEQYLSSVSNLIRSRLLEPGVAHFTYLAPHREAP